MNRQARKAIAAVGLALSVLLLVATGASASPVQVAETKKNAGTTMAIDGDSVYWVKGGTLFRSPFPSGKRKQLAGAGNRNVKQVRAGNGSVAYLTYRLDGWKGIFKVYVSTDGKKARLVLTTTRKWTPKRKWCGESAKLLGFDPDGSVLIARSTGGAHCKSAATHSLWKLPAQAGKPRVELVAPLPKEILAARGNRVAIGSRRVVELWTTDGQPALRWSHEFAVAPKEVSFDDSGNLIADATVNGQPIGGADPKLSYRACGKAIVGWLDDKKGAAISVVRAPFGQPRGSMLSDKGSVRAFSCNGERVAYILADSTKAKSHARVKVDSLDGVAGVEIDPLQNDGVTNDSTPTITGSTDAGSQVTVTIRGQSLPATVVGSKWSVTFAALTDGEKLPVVVSARDVFNDVGQATASISIDTVAPEQPSIDGCSYSSSADNLDVSGSGAAGSRVTVVIEGRSESAKVDYLGYWSIKDGFHPLSSGQHSYEVSAADDAGNVSTVLTGSFNLNFNC